MPLQATSGTASYDAFGGGVAVVPTYIEDVFSDYLYSGTSASNTINNGVDASGKGALVWIKDRGAASTPHMWFDTTRGVGKYIQSNSTGSQGNIADTLTAFNTNGFTLGADSFGVCNASGHNYVSWMFREAPKFFDVVTYTGNGVAGRDIPHSLGSVPGCIFVKRTSGADPWFVYHRSTGSGQAGQLNSTAAFSADSIWNYTDPTSTNFTVSSSTNTNGATFVAYILAHDAGGFGLTGTDNVISCGSYTTDASGYGTISIGYEPQLVLLKRSDAADGWQLHDVMRGASNTTYALLAPNNSNAESSGSSGLVVPTSTGFKDNQAIGVNATVIYIAIRRGPMKVPTSGTSVYNADTTITATTPAAVSGFVTDLMISTNRTNKATYNEMFWSNRLTANGYTSSTNTTAEQAGGAFGAWDTMNGSGTSALQSAGVSDMAWLFRRAPNFFDEVCYTGTGSATTFNHNLGAVPEMMIVKKRNASTGINWSCYHVALGNTQVISLNEDIQAYTSTQWNNTTPTASVFSVGTQSNVNASGSTYVAYLFASCNGVSKVGSYTGTGTTQQINCGFTGGARFILIKRTDEVASGNPWYVWDSARGIVAGNDPYLLLNSTAAEVTNTDYVDAYSAGFEISSTAPSSINASGGTFIYLAIA